MPFEDGKHPGGRPPTSKHPVIVDSVREQLEAEARARIMALARVKLTAELIDAICLEIPSGNYPSVIAQSLGITQSTFQQWMREGRTAWETRESPETTFTTRNDPLGLRVELYLRVSEVEAGWEVDLVKEMDEKITTGKSWTGQMTMLQRRKPERWESRGRGEGTTEKTWEERLAELEKDRARPAPTSAG